jgi:hypothetical protein
MPEVERILPEDILPGKGGGRVALLTPLQTVGVRGALIVGVFSAAVLLLLLARWIYLDPPVPKIPANFDEKQAALILSRYKEIQGAVLDSTTKMIDTIVVRILLPVFTSFVGFVFGTQVAGKSS